MREPLFLKQNRPKWEEYEDLLFGENSGEENPDRLADLYIQLTDDLGYARTFYPRSKVIKYLNGLAARTHLLIYQNKKEKSNRILTFFTNELPMTYYNNRKYLYYSFIVFILSAGLGWLSTVKDVEIPNLVLGDDYVNMTIENIKKGNPTGVYQESGSFDMFFQIAFNNIAVAFRCFASGIVFGIGTLFMLFYNGFMVGTFLGLFYNHNEFSEAFPVIMIHGTLELSAIVIAGGAGFCLGSGFMFPGTYKRILSFQTAAKDSVKIILGLVPVFTIAAFFESYVTRYAKMPLIIKLLIIILSFTYIVWYYFIFPAIVHHQLKTELYGKNSSF